MNEKNPENHGVETEEALYSPEIIDEVMEKVSDINKKDTAYTCINFDWQRLPGDYKEKLEPILQHGILGSEPTKELPTPQSWRDQAREKHYTSQGEKEGKIRLFWEKTRDDMRKKEEEFVSEGGQITHQEVNRHGRKLVVHFNLVGRNRDEFSPNETEISQSFYMGRPNAVGVVFDHSTFKENPQDQWEEGLINASAKPKTFHVVKNIDAYYSDVQHEGQLGEEKSHTETGFVLSPRIAPRFFKGIVFNGPLDESKSNDEKIVIDESPGVLEAKALEIADCMTEVYKDNPQSLLPIYDVHGNLWWPKKLSREEIQALEDAGESQ